MDKKLDDVRIQILRPSIPARCICRSCRMEKRFLKDREHLIKVEDLGLDRRLLLLVRRISARRRNQEKAFQVIGFL